MKNNKKYVVLQHLTMPDKGKRFWSMNSDDNTHGYNGELWYKEILFTDDEDEATKACSKLNINELPSNKELEEYYRLNLTF